MPYAPPLEDLKPKHSKHHPFSRHQFQERWQLIALVTGIILVLGLLIFWGISRRKGGILIEVNETNNLTITLNDRTTHPKQQDQGLFLSVYPGHYVLKVSKPDFIPFQQDILLTKGQLVTLRPAFALLPKESGGDLTTTIDYVRPSQDQKTLFYLGDNRRTIFRMEIANRVPVALTSQPLSKVSDIQWSGKPDVALISQTDGAYLLEIPSFDFRHQTLVKLGGTEVHSAIWDPTNPERMACIYAPSTGENSLVFSDKKFSKLDRKADLHSLKNPRLVWSPDANFILLIEGDNDHAKNNLWLYTTANGNLSQLTDSGSINDASFSPDSQHILYESPSRDAHDPLAASLNLMQVDGNNKHPLGINGRVAQAAWKNANQFYLPDLDKNALALYDLDGKREDLAFSFSDPGIVQGMFYFSQSKTLIFYTSKAIYTINLDG